MNLGPGLSNRQLLLVAAVCMALLIPAFALDATVAMHVRMSGLEFWCREAGTGKLIATICKAPGSFLTTSYSVYWTWLIPAAALCLWHPLKAWAGGFLCLANLMGLVTNLLKWINGRTRPFKLHADLTYPEPFILQPFRDGWIGLFRQTNLAFPSGHATTAFASAAAMAILLPKWRWAFYAMAAVVAAERVAENAHYLSDTIAGAGLSIVGVHVMWRISLHVAQRRARLGGNSVTLDRGP